MNYSRITITLFLLFAALVAPWWVFGFGVAAQSLRVFAPELIVLALLFDALYGVPREIFGSFTLIMTVGTLIFMGIGILLRKRIAMDTLSLPL